MAKLKAKVKKEKSKQKNEEALCDLLGYEKPDPKLKEKTDKEKEDELEQFLNKDFTVSKIDLGPVPQKSRYEQSLEE